MRLRDFRSVALIGGSFNPIHNGHLSAANEVRCLLGVEHVIFVPSGFPPHKGRFDLASGDDRLAMCIAATTSNPNFSVSQYELKRCGMSFTIDTITAFRAAMDDSARLYFIVGADAASLMPKWKSPEKLFERCCFVAVTRPGYMLEQPFDEPERHLISIEVPPFDISSTEIRSRVRLGMPIKYMVPSGVERYIINHGLYASDSTVDLASITANLSKTLKPSRYRHTLGVVREAEKLAARYGASAEKARIAALLHDSAKAFGVDEFNALIAFSGDKYLSNIAKKYPKVAHAFFGAVSATRDYGIVDQDILNAIRYHTTGRPGMSILEKIIFIADAIEENRQQYPGLDELRKLAYQNIDKAMLLGLNQSVAYVEPSVLHPLTKSAILYFKMLKKPISDKTS